VIVFDYQGTSATGVSISIWQKHLTISICFSFLSLFFEIQFLQHSTKCARAIRVFALLLATVNGLQSQTSRRLIAQREVSRQWAGLVDSEALFNNGDPETTIQFRFLVNYFHF
jgi:hypothetical protein